MHSKNHSFRPYPKHKDSGVQWLGEIPAHWEAKKIKRLCLVRRGASPRPIEDPIYFDENGEYAWVRIADVTASERYLCQTTQRLSELGRSKSVSLEPGELFLSIAATVGKPIITKIKCCIHDGFVYFTGLMENKEFLYYLFNCGEAYKGLGKLGTQLNLNTDTIGDIYIPVPPTNEQSGVVQFLDRETSKIDALVSKKEKLIELLQEKRTALITRAVTTGLDPNVPMKDSGEDWLGEVPEHWEVKRMKNLSDFVTSGSRGWAQHYSDDGNIFLRIGNLNTSSIDLNLTKIQRVSPPSSAEGMRTRVQAGDVIVSITALIGAVAVAPEDLQEAYVNQHLALIRPKEKSANSRWIAYCVLSRVGQEQMLASLYGGTKDGLGLEDIRSLLILLPPAQEQNRIVGFLDEECTKSNELVAKIREAIARLKEYRTALISAAVTGKIDVREELA